MSSESPEVVGLDSFARTLSRTACAQIVYAQVERIVKAKNDDPSPRHKQAPMIASQIHATRGVADALADLLRGFIVKIGRESKDRAELAGRTHASLIEVCEVLNKMSRVTRTRIRDLAAYANYEELPFPRALEHFPIRKKPKNKANSAKHAKQELKWPRSEPWMPPLPAPHTYIATPVYVKPELPEDAPKPSVGEQRRQAERSLALLRKKRKREEDAALLSASISVENPFLAPPKVGEGDVIDEDSAGPPRDPPKVGGDADGVGQQSKLKGDSSGKGPEAKRLRVDRILAESASL